VCADEAASVRGGGVQDVDATVLFADPTRRSEATEALFAELDADCDGWISTRRAAAWCGHCTSADSCRFDRAECPLAHAALDKPMRALLHYELHLAYVDVDRFFHLLGTDQTGDKVR